MKETPTQVLHMWILQNFEKQFCSQNILVAASVSTHSLISFKPFTFSKINVASDLSKIGNFLIDDWGKLANLRKPIRVIRFSDKYDLRFHDLSFDVELLLEVALLFELELLIEVELLFDLELLLQVGITIRSQITIRSRIIIRSLVTIKSQITIRSQIIIRIPIIDRNRNTVRSPINIRVR